MREVRWERMFPDELEAAFAACPMVYLAYGLCEPHGPQNAVGLDALKAHGIACESARQHGGIVAPPDYWHIHELGGYAVWAHGSVGQVERAWMTAVPPWVHFRNICYQLRAVDHLGFHAAILLTGHYGPNWEDLKTLVELAQPHVGARLHALPDFEANEPGFKGDGSSGDHAGKVETSLLWAIEPECVDISRLPESDAPGPHFAMGGNAYDSDRRAGEQMVADEVAWLGGKARELLEAYGSAEPTQRLRTYEQVESLWDDVIVPAFSDFKTMQPRWADENVPEGSVWRANWPIPDRR